LQSPPAKRLRHKHIALPLKPSFIPFPFGFSAQAASSNAFFFSLFSFTKQFFMVYLIHFSSKLHHAQHYVGFVDGNLPRRIRRHKSGRGAKLLAAVTLNGIGWQVVRVWPEGNREFERKLKNYKKARCFCPVCCRNHQFSTTL
jgi:predicted GIY-YIG superfamily endonuclease